jgi:predicted amidohydrolase
MQDLNIALLQFNQSWENKSENFEKISSFLKDETKIDLLLLPEMFHTGYTMNHELLSETMSNSEGLRFLKNISKEKNCAIYTSLIISENNKVFNRGVFISPDEHICHYDKRKTFGLAGEDEFYMAGTQEKIVAYKGWKFNLQICYDLRFPELVANCINQKDQVKYDVILYVANWPDKRASHWNKLLQARAIENQADVLACNRVGTDQKKITYSGGSCVINALGEVQVKELNNERLIRYKLCNSRLLDIRQQLPFLKDRSCL